MLESTDGCCEVDVVLRGVSSSTLKAAAGCSGPIATTTTKISAGGGRKDVARGDVLVEADRREHTGDDGADRALLEDDRLAEAQRGHL